MKTDGLYKYEHNLTFTEKKWYEHIWNFLRILIGEFGVFIPSALALWGLIEVLIKIGDNRIPTKELILLVFLIAFAVTLYTALSKYFTYTPEALTSESEEVKRTFRKQKCGWQYKLAFQMLSNRINNIELTLDRVANNSEFIKPHKLSFEEYHEWSEMRPEILLRLVKSVAIQCTKDLPMFLATLTSDVQLNDLKNKVLSLVHLYEVAKDFEIECYQLIPPDSFSHVHEMSYGWTVPIRDGINEFKDVLLKLSSYDIKSIKAGAIEPPSFNIVFDKPTNVDEYCNRLRNVRPE